MEKRKEEEAKNQHKKIKTQKENIYKLGAEIDEIEEELKTKYETLEREWCDFNRERKDYSDIEEEEKKEKSLKERTKETVESLERVIGKGKLEEYKKEIKIKVKPYKEGRERIATLCDELNDLSRTLKRYQRELNEIKRNEREAARREGRAAEPLESIEDLYLEIAGTIESIERRESEIAGIVEDLGLEGVNL